MTIPNSVTVIENEAFENCSSLTSVTIPESVTEIRKEAFKYCSKLTSVTIPNSVTIIYWWAFSYCSSLTSVTIPNSVTVIKDSAFKNCSSLTSVTIPDSVTEIEGETFSNCSGLMSVTIPNSVTTIGKSAFNGCSELTSVTIPNSVTEIGIWAFYGCSSLTSVTIPNSVTHIERSVFFNCSELKSVTIKATTPPICDESVYRHDIFDECYIHEYQNFSVYNTLYVPMESVDLYKNASPWKQFKHIIGVDFSDKPIYHVEAKLYVLGTELQNKENELVTIYDATGKAVMRSDSSNISMETLEPGIYTIATTWGFFKYERCESVYQAEAKLYVSGAVLQNKNNDLVTIYDATGKAVMKSAASIISMEELPKGTYMVATIWGSFMIER